VRGIELGGFPNQMAGIEKPGAIRDRSLDLFPRQGNLHSREEVVQDPPFGFSMAGKDKAIPGDGGIVSPQLLHNAILNESL
jgi:hypothetical protein